MLMRNKHKKSKHTFEENPKTRRNYNEKCVRFAEIAALPSYRANFHATVAAAFLTDATQPRWI